MKKFWRYFFIFILAYTIINGLTYLATIKTYNNINSYTIECGEPEVVIAEAKSAYSGGYIEGTVTNNTDSIMNLKYLRFEFFNENGTYLGTEFKELKYFNVGEEQKFEIEHTYKQVADVTIDLVDEKNEREVSEWETAIKTWWPVAFFIGKLALL